MSVTPDDVARAAERLGAGVVRTPLRRSDAFSEAWGADVSLKCEHLQRTGSFKIRGATNALKLLTRGTAAVPLVVTASSGNHGRAVATAAAPLGVDCRVFVARSAAASKVDAIRRAGAAVQVVDTSDGLVAEEAARTWADEHGAPYLSPYNDAAVIAGQGTVGWELTAQREDAPDVLVVPVGGGGLISGIATWVRAAWPDVEVVGASPITDAGMAASVEAGEVVSVGARPTLSDGTAGNVERGSLTFDLCSRLVDRWVLVREVGIASAVLDMIGLEHELVEGAAGVALAAAHKLARKRPGARIVVVCSGANLGVELLRRMVELTADEATVTDGGRQDRGGDTPDPLPLPPPQAGA